MTVYGRISGIKPYGAFVKFDDGVNGLIHISELSSGFVRNISNFVDIDEYVLTKVIDIDYEHKQLRLSFKALNESRRRYSRKAIKYQGLPENKIGFKTLKDNLDGWIKGEFHD